MKVNNEARVKGSGWTRGSVAPETWQNWATRLAPSFPEASSKRETWFIRFSVYTNQKKPTGQKQQSSSYNTEAREISQGIFFKRALGNVTVVLKAWCGPVSSSLPGNFLEIHSCLCTLGVGRSNLCLNKPSRLFWSILMFEKRDSMMRSNVPTTYHPNIGSTAINLIGLSLLTVLNNRGGCLLVVSALHHSLQNSSSAILCGFGEMVSREVPPVFGTGWSYDPGLASDRTLFSVPKWLN